MKESALEERQRRLELSQSVRRPNFCKSPQELKKQKSEIKDVKSNVTTPLVATAALQAYLANDNDAKSVDNQVLRMNILPNEMTLDKASLMSEKRQVSTIPPNLHGCRCVNDEKNSGTTSDVATRLAESPLSRFRKHITLSHMLPNQFSDEKSLSRSDTQNVQRIGSSLNLAQCLMHKINEAKSLRLTGVTSDVHISKHNNSEIVSIGSQSSIVSGSNRIQSVKEAMPSLPITSDLNKCPNLPSTGAGLIATPPVPHSKPVMPAIPHLLSASTPEKTDKSESPFDAATRNKAPQTNTISCTSTSETNGAAFNQQILRKTQSSKDDEYNPKCERHNHNSQMFAIEKQNADVVFSVANANSISQRKIEMKTSHEINSKCSLENNSEADVQNSCTESFESSHITHCPWIDHELIFLEEGRGMGGHDNLLQMEYSVNQDEVVWKRHQHVIQQVEHKRILKLRKIRQIGFKTQNQLTLRVDCNKTPDLIENSILEGAKVSTTPAFEKAGAKSANLELTNRGMLFRKRKLSRVHFSNRNCSRRESKFRCTKRFLINCKKYIHSQNTARPRRDKTRIKQSKKTEAKHTQFQDNNKPKTEQCDQTKIAEIERMNRNVKQILNADVTSKPDTPSQFIVFSENTLPSNGSNSKLSRNDLITMGDLALARNLLCNVNPCHTTNDSFEVKYQNEFIPMTLSVHKVIIQQPEDPTVEM
ncbi:hypothetical protein Plhal710r2_c083g0181071 [Plasmopara halstedii]